MVLLPHTPLPYRLLTVVCSALLLLAACSGDSVSQVQRAVEPTPIAAPAGLGSNGEELTLEVVDGGDATGLVITDYRGFAVYGVAGETTSDGPRCIDECLGVWIPVAPRGDAVTNQLDASLFRVWARPDGIEQAVYADIPLYLWSGDREIGITGGAGVAGTWFALTETAGFVAAA